MRFNKMSLAVAGLLLAGAAEARSVRQEDGILISEERFAKLRRTPSSWSGLLARCRQDLRRTPSPVAVFSPGLRYTPRGTRRDAQTEAFAGDALSAYRTALCFKLTGDRRFATHAQSTLDAWAGTMTRIDGRQGQNVVTFNTPQMTMAASWIRGHGKWNDGAFRRFLKTVALPNSRSVEEGNHGNWGVLMDATVAAYLDDEEGLRRAAARWQELVGRHFAPDGTLPREICRTATSNWCDGPDKGIKGMAYTHYTLLPTALAAKVLHDRKIDVFGTDAGAKLRLAYRRAAAWTLSPETFPYYASNAGKLHDVGHAAYFKILQRHIPEPDGAAVLAQGRITGDRFELLALL